MFSLTTKQVYDITMYTKRNCVTLYNSKSIKLNYLTYHVNYLYQTTMKTKQLLWNSTAMKTKQINHNTCTCIYTHNITSCY